MKVVLILIIFCIILLEFALNFLAVKERQIRISQTIFLLAVSIIYIIETKNWEIITVLAAILFSMTYVLREPLADIFASIFMYFVPQFEKNDIIKVNNIDDKLIYNGLNFMKTNLIAADGTIVQVPNRIILNETTSVS